MANTESLWMATAPSSGYPQLEGDTSVDVAVIGGGIAGICCAYQLRERGFSVAVLEANRVCAGVTGYTTAKVTSAHQLIYDKLASNLGDACGHAYAEANQWGVEWMAEHAQRLGIECDLMRKPMLVYAETAEDLNQLQGEFEKAKEFGLPVSWTEEVDLPIETIGAIRYENQVQFHPRKFVLQLAERLLQNGGEIYERTRALEVTEGDPCTVSTDRGAVTARYVVVASHYPIYDPAMYLARLAPYRDYAVAARVRGHIPQDMSIGAGATAKAFRMQPSAEGDLLVVSGETHKAGQEPDTTARYESLEGYVREHFDLESIPYRWSTQDNVTLDSMPYIGKISPDSERCFVITGFGAWGMSTSPYGARILTDLATGADNSWIRVFDPNRFKGWERLKTAVKENVNAVSHLVGDKLTDTDDRSISELAAGEAAILKVDGEKIAAYRDWQGALHAVSPICTHIGCDIGWNPAEESWDCPCHGSRFSPDGEVIQGPAIKDLESKLEKVALATENKPKLI